MNLECPDCGSSDVDVAPRGARGDFECQECGHLFTEAEIAAAADDEEEIEVDDE